MQGVGRKFNVEKYISVARKPIAYDESAKKDFLRMGRQLAIIMASRMGLNEDQYDVRVNKAGPAVSGEVVLHTEDHYVFLGQFSGILEPGFLVRSCKGRNDYTGGRNHFVKWEDLRDLDKVVRFIKSLA